MSSSQALIVASGVNRSAVGLRRDLLCYLHGHLGYRREVPPLRGQGGGECDLIPLVSAHCAGLERDRPMCSAPASRTVVVCAGDGSVSEDDDYPRSIVSCERNLLISLSSAMLKSS